MKTPKKIMQAARGEPCTFNIVGHCTHSNDTVVACHLPDGSGGSNRLTGPLSIAFGCGPCHTAIDQNLLRKEDAEFYMRRGMMRTINRLIAMELVKI